VLVWVVVAVLVAWNLWRSHVGMLLGIDVDPLWSAARAAVQGETPFSIEHPFVYLPSTALLVLPFGLAPNDVLKGLLLVLTAVGVPLAAALSVRLAGLPARSWLAALLALATTLTLPGQYAYALLNFMVVSLVLLPVVLALLRQERWIAAAALVGAAVAVKPMLVPLGWFAVLSRRWLALLVMAGIPLAASVLALVLLPEPSRFFTEVLPWLLGGEDERLWPYLSALLPVALAQGWPLGLVNVVRLAVAASALVLATALWRRTSDPTLRVVESTGVLLAGSFLAFSAATPIYLLLLLPLLASAVRPGAIARSTVGWVGVVIASLPGFVGDDLGEAGISRRVALGLLLAYVGWCGAAARRLARDQRLDSAVAGAGTT
jgi:arabinofuranan 3-O-arabinosyltransferase